MKQMIRIENEVALARFLHDVDGLHDAILHEAIFLHPGFVDSEGEMFGDAEYPDARLIFQSQFRDIGALQLDLKAVSRFSLDAGREFECEGEIIDGEMHLYLLGKASRSMSEIRAAMAEYRLLGREFLGPEYHFCREGVGSHL